MATEEDRERMGLPQEDEFNPLSEEELREREEAEEFRRRVRREILRVQSGEADEDIARDREQEAEEQREREEAEQRTARKRSRLFWQIFSGNILVNRSVAENYRYFAAIAVMCFAVSYTHLTLPTKLEV